MGILYDVVCFPFKILGAVLDCVIAIACCYRRPLLVGSVCW